MHYILTPSANGIFWYADEYVYYEKRTSAEKQDVQSRWDARKLRQHVTKNILQNADQPLKKL